MKKVFIPINTKIPVERQFPNRVPIWGNYEFIIPVGGIKIYYIY